MRPAFEQDVRERKKEIQVVRIAKDVIKKVNKFLISLGLSMSKMRVMKVIKKTSFSCLVTGYKNFLTKKNYK